MGERVAQPPFTEWYSGSDVVLQAKVVGDAYPRFKLTADGVIATGSGSGAPTDSSSAVSTSYDHTTSALAATNVQAALDEIVVRLAALEA